jgi:hypothetical protein
MTERELPRLPEPDVHMYHGEDFYHIRTVRQLLAEARREALEEAAWMAADFKTGLAAAQAIRMLKEPK